MQFVVGQVFDLPRVRLNADVALKWQVKDLPYFCRALQTVVSSNAMRYMVDWHMRSPVTEWVGASVHTPIGASGGAGLPWDEGGGRVQ